MTMFLRDQDKCRQQSVSFGKGMRDKIITIAENEDLSFSQVVNLILSRYLKEREEKYPEGRKLIS